MLASRICTSSYEEYSIAICSSSDSEPDTDSCRLAVPLLPGRARRFGLCLHERDDRQR